MQVTGPCYSICSGKLNQSLTCTNCTPANPIVTQSLRGMTMIGQIGIVAGASRRREMTCDRDEHACECVGTSAHDYYYDSCTVAADQPVALYKELQIIQTLYRSAANYDGK
jgi:hypothetical protein